MKKQSAMPIGKRGSGLIFAVVLLFVILGMVITLASVTVLETKMNQKTKSSIGAFYNSESGVEWALNKISISSGTISSTLSANSDGSVTCPISPDCKVYFLKSDGTVITQANFSTLTFNDIKAVRSVGTQGTGGAADTQRAIEAAVASGGIGKYQLVWMGGQVLCRMDTETGEASCSYGSAGGWEPWPGPTSKKMVW